MSVATSQVEERLAALVTAVHALEQRVATLERRAGVAPVGLRRPAAAKGIPQADGGPGWTGQVALVGRTLVALAGAFVLRAVADAGAVPLGVGVLLGLAYAAAWLVVADRVAPARARSAVFHGVAALAVAAPLVVEATARFRLLPPAAGLLLLAAFTAAALLVAGRRRLPALAWVAEAAGIAAALAVAIGTERLSAALLFLVLLGAATLALADRPGWRHLRWAPALVADLTALVLTLGARPGGAEPPLAAAALDLLLLVAYLAVIAARALRGRPARDFEVIQLLAALGCGLGGAALVAARAGAGQAAVGAVAVALACGGYAVASGLERRLRARTDATLHAAVALVLLLAGTALLLPRAALPFAWAALAVAAALAARGRHLAAAAHACVLALAAGLAAGALGHASATAFTSPAAPWPHVPAALPWAVLGMAATAWLTRAGAPAPPWRRAPRCALLAGLALGSAAVALGWIVPPLAGAPGPGAHLLVAATARTAVFVAGVVLLAWAGRFDGWREAGWLAYPALAAVGVQLLLENLARTAAASLVLAFALYGAALILVPRLRRPPGPPAEPAAGPTRSPLERRHSA